MTSNTDSSILMKKICEQLREASDLKMELKKQADIVLKIANEMVSVFKRGNKVMLFGNGGSAADAQHLAAELAGKYYRDREPLPAIALTANTSILTALANDYSYSEVFLRQVRALADRGDMVIGISTSGNSNNIVLAMEEARNCGAVTVAFTGKGGKIKDIADFCLAVPSNDTPRIQEAHITAGHIICYLVEELLFGGAL